MENLVSPGILVRLPFLNVYLYVIRDSFLSP